MAKILGIGSEVKIINPEGPGNKRDTKTVVAITKDGITLNDGSKIGKAEIEFCLDASKVK